MSRPTSSAGMGGRWVQSASPDAPGGITFKDFLPMPDPDRSTCCSRQYSTFSETVQMANEWLGRYEGAQVVACETLPFTTRDAVRSVLAATWHSVTHLSGLRVWLKNPVYDEESRSAAGLPGRVLLSYRDFTPRLGGKSLFSRGYEDSHVLLGRLNDYLRDRVTPARILSVHTLDTPMDGVLDVGADTEKSRISYAQHGFTRYCRFLRVFSVTRYQHGPLDGPAPKVKVRLKDFLPKTQESRSERLSDLVKRALLWCAMTPFINVLNLQVVPLRAGAENTVASTWLLESPGHIANKFSSFVRVIYTTESSEEEDVSSSSPPDENSNAVIAPIEKGGDEKEENGDASIPGAVRDAAPALTGSSQIIHCKTFVPRLVSSGGLCGNAEWESMQELLERLNAWVVASEGSLVTLHTHLVYLSGNEIRPEETRWARPIRNAEQVGVLHAIVEGGRPPTAFPAAPPLPSRKCAIM
ncbi:uncharacterized protein LOC122253037 [Penaeus japonicus]|uniref:uncharacterized protein LOC122253037 n=1 Tax=Penaeus japonicus TaxID=27405 RepID=UPI001C712BBA|nr:uncharacterized protein LOC122253037 [Penaeus japonicus]